MPAFNHSKVWKNKPRRRCFGFAASLFATLINSLSRFCSATLHIKKRSSTFLIKSDWTRGLFTVISSVVLRSKKECSIKSSEEKKSFSRCPCARTGTKSLRSVLLDLFAFPAYLKNLFGGVAQLVRARGSYPRRRRFDSAHRHQFLSLSFLVNGHRAANFA
jgi:hypothetical protein